MNLDSAVDMPIKNSFVFNFSASYSGGGYKRLYEFAKWFDKNGGAWFVVHPRSFDLKKSFPNNRFFVAKQSRVERVFNDCAYLDEITKEIGRPNLYYSYGIPIYSRFGKVNWFHLSNVLPLHAKKVPLTLFDRVSVAYLGRQIRRNLVNADVISAESAYSLGLVEIEESRKLFMSVNGSDDEVAYLQNKDVEPRNDFATVVGTSSYKGLSDSFSVFQTLKRKHGQLMLMVIGNPQWIPRSLLRSPDLVVRGMLSRQEVIACLRRSKFYISTTHIENSYNAASEGIFLADESYISDIGPHRELLKDEVFDEIFIPNVSRQLLRVSRNSLAGKNLKTWEIVIGETISRFKDAARSL